MSTKPPAAVQQFPKESIEAVAYASVSTIPTVEPNDRTRLGFHVWRWLAEKQGTLEQAISSSGSRIEISKQEAEKIIREALTAAGVTNQ